MRFLDEPRQNSEVIRIIEELKRRLSLIDRVEVPNPCALGKMVESKSQTTLFWDIPDSGRTFTT